MGEIEYDNSFSEKIEAKRGGYAVVFIYAGFFIVTAYIGTKFTMLPYYLYMAIAIIAVFCGYYLTPIVFNKPVISASKDGLWTRKLKLVSWHSIKDIRIEKSTRFSPKGFGRVDIDLIIEITNGSTDTFDIMYLNVDGEALSKELIKYWKANTPIYTQHLIS